MFEVGMDYRVFLDRGETFKKIKGELLSVDGSLIKLNVEGIETIFHIGSSPVAYVELVDAEAEKARDKARGQKMIDSYR